MKINAAVAHGNGQPLSHEKIDLAEPRSDELLVRIVASGICETDMTVMKYAPLP